MSSLPLPAYRPYLLRFQPLLLPLLSSNNISPRSKGSSPHRRHREPGLLSGPQNYRFARAQCGIQPKGWFYRLICHIASMCATYLPWRFATVIMRILDPKTTALIFASGKTVVTGAKSEGDSRLASRKYACIVQKLGFNAIFSRFRHSTAASGPSTPQLLRLHQC